MLFSIVPVIVMLGFVVVFGIIIVTAAKSLSQWNKNNNSPRLTVDAKVVAKRQEMRRHTHGGAQNSMHHTSHSTQYYVTFQVDSGDRLELSVPNHEFGYFIEGDSGKLTFQGTRYLSFVRI